MSYDNFKEDFFTADICEKKGRKPEVLKHRYLPFVKIPTEYTVIFAVIILVLMVIAYAVGVERGKRRAFKEDASSSYETDKEASGEHLPVSIETVEDVLSQDVTEKDIGSVDILGIDTAPSEGKSSVVEGTKPLDKGNVEKEMPEREYTVQLASFKAKDAAKDEVNKLVDKGFNADFLSKGEWYQVYTFGYYTIEEAKEAKTVLSEDYRDCFIRRVK